MSSATLSIGSRRPQKYAHLGASPAYSIVSRSRIVAALCRSFVCPTAWNSFAPSPRNTGTEAVGYHRTFPNPRSQVPSLVTLSQSASSASSAGAPIRSSRPAEPASRPE